MSVAEPEADARAMGEMVLRTKGLEHLLYARVDLVVTSAGWAVMELELVEPSLFLSFYEPAARTLASAIARRLT